MKQKFVNGTGHIVSHPDGLIIPRRRRSASSISTQQSSSNSRHGQGIGRHLCQPEIIDGSTLRARERLERPRCQPRLRFCPLPPGIQLRSLPFFALSRSSPSRTQ